MSMLGERTQCCHPSSQRRVARRFRKDKGSNKPVPNLQPTFTSQICETLRPGISGVLSCSFNIDPMLNLQRLLLKVVRTTCTHHCECRFRGSCQRAISLRHRSRRYGFATTRVWFWGRLGFGLAHPIRRVTFTPLLLLAARAANHVES